jgi:DNA topoisomerase-3
MDVDDGSGASLDQRIQQAVLNAMHAQGNSGMGAKTQTQRSYSQEREQRGGGRGGRGGQSGGRGGRFGMRSGPLFVPGVPEQVVRERYHAQQCLRCGQGGHISHACPNAISASGN